MAASGLAPRVARALASLPAEQRDVLLLHAWGGLPDEEVAVALGLPAGTVRSRLWRARSALRSQLLGTGANLDAPEPLRFWRLTWTCSRRRAPRGKWTWSMRSSW